MGMDEGQSGRHQCVTTAGGCGPRSWQQKSVCLSHSANHRLVTTEVERLHGVRTMWSTHTTVPANGLEPGVISAFAKPYSGVAIGYKD